ncbi:MAG: hypothetical protein H7Y20_13300 [Bryobacteraceae bacterium]|nr:hypothetical protein [Bryobacteraceae bacterium]
MSPMGQSLGPAGAAASSSFLHTASGSRFTTRWDGNALRQTIERGGLAADHPVAFAIGSGNHARGFVIRVDKRLYQSPIAFYPRKGSWDVAPGYEANSNPDFNRPVTTECLLCHSGTSGAIPGAITCERCHGSSELHLRKPSRATILNPSRLAPAERDSVCEQCHLSGEGRILHPEKDFADFQPGQRLEDVFSTFVQDRPRDELKVVSHVEQLALSACAQNSNGRLWCGSCHTAHGEPVSFRDRCLQCHAQTLSAEHLKRAGECSTCHMPKRAVVDGSHTAFTDHRIQRNKATEVTAGKSSVLKAWRALPDAAAGQRNLGLAYIAVGEREGSAEQINRGYRLLSEVYPRYPKDSEVLSALGMVLFLKDEFSSAVRLLQTAIANRPGHAPLYEKLAVVHRAAGRRAEASAALEKALALDPARESAYHMQADLNTTPEQRKQALERYLLVMPQSLLAREAIRTSAGR